MRRWLVRAGVLLLPLAAAMILGFWLLPQLVEALPGQVRGRLPDEVLRLVTTPLPTALPRPDLPAATVDILLPTLIAIDATPVSAPPTLSPARDTSQLEPEATPENVPTATPLATPYASPTLAPPPRAALIEGLEIVPQKFNNCGPTNLSINLSFYGDATTQFDVADVVKPNYDDRNVSPDELAAYVNEQTRLKAQVYYGGNLETLKQLIAAGFPVVIEKGYIPDEWQGWMGHYLTLFGYDDSSQTFLSMDTFLGPWDGAGREYSYEQIEERWADFNRTFFVVYTARQEPTVKRILGPILTEAPVMWRQALHQANADIQRDANDAFAWFNLGSSFTALAALEGDDSYYESAAAAFDRARILGLPARMLWYQFAPYEAYLKAGRPGDVLTLTGATLEDRGGQNVEESYLYRGHALLAEGELEAAAAAYQQALRLKPNYSAAADALAALDESQF